MSIRNFGQVLNIDNIDNLNHLTIDLSDTNELALGLFSVSLRDYKMLQFIKEQLHSGNGVTINYGYKANGL